ncbi:MAG: FKBP-type peptidyl-prolyl cis-trans isomerase [Flavisolibacter sp.]
MKCFQILFLTLCYFNSHSAGKDSTVRYQLPDSVKAISFIADINVHSIATKKEVFAGIRTSMAGISFEAEKNKKEIVFEFPKSAKILSTGLGVNKDEKGELELPYQWNINETYKLMLAVASDSAENFALYSAYVWLASEKKWKLIGSCKISGQRNTLQDPSSFVSSSRKRPMTATIDNAWCQRSNGTWRKLDDGPQPMPIVNLVSNVDSVQEFLIEKQQIENAIAAGQTDVKENIDGVYYKIVNEGTGRQVALTDIVTVNYKGYLFGNGEVFDETKDKPATFPLNRLIKGWQLAVPLLKVGGKIKMVIPSAMAYSIRPRAAKIPPNSILVFEVEVVDAKE